MPREIITRLDMLRFHESGPTPSGASVAAIPYGEDHYSDRLLKYIPAEAVVCYLFVLGIMGKLTDQAEIKIFQWSVFVVFCMLTALYLWRVLKVRKIMQLAISVIAFVVWVFALGGPFALLTWYNPVYGEILLPVFTFAIALFEAEK
ncbi:MAG TPA: hypothetical protein VJ203_09300 [Bacteroidales bacterium]|nr:hypothetical protein [Bacteroidales bacterium]